MISENKKYLSFAHHLADKTGKILIKNYKSSNLSRDLKTSKIEKNSY